MLKHCICSSNSSTAQYNMVYLVCNCLGCICKAAQASDHGVCLSYNTQESELTLRSLTWADNPESAFTMTRRVANINKRDSAGLVFRHGFPCKSFLCNRNRFLGLPSGAPCTFSTMPFCTDDRTSASATKRHFYGRGRHRYRKLAACNAMQGDGI